jgi:hypothetical protein
MPFDLLLFYYRLFVFVPLHLDQMLEYDPSVSNNVKTADAKMVECMQWKFVAVFFSHIFPYNRGLNQFSGAWSWYNFGNLFKKKNTKSGKKKNMCKSEYLETEKKSQQITDTKKMTEATYITKLKKVTQCFCLLTFSHPLYHKHLTVVSLSNFCKRFKNIRRCEQIARALASPLDRTLATEGPWSVSTIGMYRLKK